MEPQSVKQANKKYFSSVGRRKEAIARARLFEGVGQVTVNGKPIHEYFLGQIFQKAYQKPFEVTNTMGKYSATIKVEGGGTSSQLGAVVHSLARVLDKADKNNHTKLKVAGLLTRDPRAKETRKYGHAQKARAKKQSPKR